MLADLIESQATPLGWLVAASVVSGIVGLLVVPWVVVRIPADYFTHRHRHRALPLSEHSLASWLLLIGKNFLGILFLLAGVMMLILPGQGILTILIGITLMDFPGKYRLEQWIVERGPVLRSINWLRRRAQRPPLAAFAGSARSSRPRSASP
jgi:hypothetical protein